jgi:hypothetical protein
MRPFATPSRILRLHPAPSTALRFAQDDAGFRSELALSLSKGCSVVAMKITQSAICNLQSAICNLQSAICNLQSAIRNPKSRGFHART